MNPNYIFWPLVVCCLGCGEVNEPAMSGGESGLNNTIPPTAEAREIPARRGEEYAREVWYFVDDNTLVGVRRYWDEKKSKLHSEELYAPSDSWRFQHKNGVQREWYKNGQLKSERPYKNDKMHGTFKQWDENGKLLGSFEMKEDSGPFQSWYPNGQVEEIRPCKNGKIHGEWRWYFDNGKLGAIAWYEEGSVYGISYSWDRDGKPEQDSPQFHVHGERVTKEEYLKAASVDTTLRRYEAQEEIR